MAKKMNYNRPVFQKKGYDLRDAGQDSRHEHKKGNGTIFNDGQKVNAVKAFRSLRGIRQNMKEIHEINEKKRTDEILKKYKWKDIE